MNKAVIIMGSSSSEGHTYRISKSISEQYGWELVDLNKYQFSYYDYQFKNKDDDFLPLIKYLIENYQTFIFSTPVYWYSMSGIMKVFLDRITDLIDWEPEWISKLENKNLYSLSNNAEENLDYPFELPFQRTAEYLKMNFIGHQHFINTIKNPNLKYQLDEWNLC